jgi:choice-of-anchor B domain-containing protein
VKPNRRVGTHPHPAALLAPALLLAVAGGLVAVAGARAQRPVAGGDGDDAPNAGEAGFAADHQPPWQLAARHSDPCVDGFADGLFPCDRVDLLAYLPLADVGGGEANDLWGWTDPVTGKEYALLGKTTGTAFVDVSDPEHPIYLGDLPSHSGSSIWRDVKVYADHALIVSEAPAHGLQVFDLTALRSVAAPPATFAETAYYGEFLRAHNVVVDEDSGFAYAVGSRQGDRTCSGGLHMIDVHDPEHPVFAGCFSADGYTHDAQCVVYTGPDADYAGHEICFASNEDSLTIVDVTDKANPAMLSRTDYAGRAYTHQGWLTEDQHYFLLDDELDESAHGHNTRTYVWDVADLDAPVVLDTYTGPVAAIDHNQYVRGNFVYQANYRSGLRILSLADVAAGQLSQVAYFDVYPDDDAAEFNGSWSVYPFLPSGVVLVSGIEQGLFVLHPNLCDAPQAPASLAAAAAGDNRIDLSWSDGGAGTTFRLYRSFGGCPGAGFEEVADGLAATAYSDLGVAGGVGYSYTVTAVEATGLCESAPSNCAEAQTTGVCNAPPAFAGASGVTNPAGAACSLVVDWPPASANCGGPVTYSIYRGAAAGFTPGADNRIASGLTSAPWVDHWVYGGAPYYYVVRATDDADGVEDANTVVRSAVPTGPVTDGTWHAGAEIGDPVLGATTTEHVGWHYAENRSHGGARSYFSTYFDSQCTALSAPPILLTAGEVPVVTFWTLHDVEEGWDGGVVEVSTDGVTWSLLPLEPAPPDVFVAAANACRYPAGTPSFSGTDLTWRQYAGDLSAYAGSAVRLRWTFSTDSGITQEGWYVDDVDVTHAQVAGPCAGVLFADGFESGDTAAWTAAAGAK